MKVAVLGNTGMLGGMLERTLKRMDGIEVKGYGRETLDLFPRSLNQIGGLLTKILGFDTDYVVNCMGATKPYFNDCSDLSIPIYANALFPHQLAQWAELVPRDIKIIHITTDCVYDGLMGAYDEFDIHSPPDVYGKSKSLGEPPNAMCLRTSIIGPEFNSNKKHFLSWVKSLSGNGEKAKGFINHFWNGLTTLELSYAIAEIMISGLYETNVFHMFSTDISKYEMVRLITEIYDLDIEIEQFRAPVAIDRRLRSVSGLNDVISPAPFNVMIKELRDWEYNEKPPF